MARKFIPKVKRESWKGKWVYTLRDKNGRLITFTKKQSVNKNYLSQLYKDNQTFSEKFKKSKTQIGKDTIVTTEYKPTTIKNQFTSPLKRQPKNRSMYSIEGYYNGSRIVANSMSDAGLTPQEKKNNAWESFLQRLDSLINGGHNYDENEGIKYIDRVTGLREGWVYYEKV